MSNGKEGSMYVYTCTCIVSVARLSRPLSQGVWPVRPAGVLFRVGFKSVHLEDVCFGCKIHSLVYSYQAQNKHQALEGHRQAITALKDSLES